MNFEELIVSLGIGDKEIHADIINPVRKGDVYQKGRVEGFKPGLFGGGHSRFKNGHAHSFSSSKMRWIKKPKILVVYNIFEMFKKEHSDWIDVDNCKFEIKITE